MNELPENNGEQRDDFLTELFTAVWLVSWPLAKLVFWAALVIAVFKVACG